MTGGDPAGNGQTTLVQLKGGGGPEVVGDGRSQDAGASPGRPRTGGDSPYPPSGRSRTEGEPSRAPNPGLAARVDWQSASYAFVLGTLCVFLVPLTSLWWVVPVLGAAVPLALAASERHGFVPKKLDARFREQELLETLAERGELTPTAAAMRTSLTVDEAAKMMDELAGKGHLKLRTEDGIVTYSLPERDRFSAAEVAPQAPRTRAKVGAASAKHLDDPLSERELEVLALLASGRTNAEISREIYVAVGTVKSHANKIYRKLGAANRVEAIARAQEMNLLR